MKDPEQIDAKTVEAIRAFTEENGYPPTVRELGALLGGISSATAQRRLDGLVERGYITRVPGARRTIAIKGANTKTEPETM